MNKPKQQNNGYQPEKTIEKGYQPSTTGNPKPHGGYTPTTTGDNPANNPTPPGKE